VLADWSTVSQAYFALNETLRIKNSQKFWGIFFFCTEVTFEAFLGSSQNLKVIRLQGGPQTKLGTCQQNFELSRLFEWFMELVHGFAVLQKMVSSIFCKTGCVSLATRFQTRPMWALQTYFPASDRFLKWCSKFFFFFKQNFERLQRFVTREPWPWRTWTWRAQGVFGSKLPFRIMSAGGRLCTFQEKPQFWVPMLKVSNTWRHQLLLKRILESRSPFICPRSYSVFSLVSAYFTPTRSVFSQWRTNMSCFPVYESCIGNVSISDT
jgi:hypothetical protein